VAEHERKRRGADSALVKTKAFPEGSRMMSSDFVSRSTSWDQIAFPTVVWALAHFHDSRGKTDFATYSNPTGDLARMWPPRKPAGL